MAEHLDHLHYLNDILCLNISDLNAVLTEHLLHKLFVPLYIFSLTPAPPPLSMALITQNLAAVLNKTVDIDIQEMNNPRVSCVVALFLLSLVFLVITHGPLVHALAWVILNADHTVFKDGAAEVLNAYIEKRRAVALGFGQPNESLEQALDASTTTADSHDVVFDGENGATATTSSNAISAAAANQLPKLSIGEGKPIDFHYFDSSSTLNEFHFSPLVAQENSENAENGSVNITDEEKEQLKCNLNSDDDGQSNESNRPFLDTVL